jgi:uncharacterized protein
MKRCAGAVLFLFFVCSLFGKPVETFYGVLEVDEPILLELIESPPMQRLKQVHQYGISYYTTHPEEYSRYDHSLGVFAILRLKGASLKEQIAGLLHDVSHTVFSHVGDYVFHRPNDHQNSFQDNVHGWFLKKYGIGDILEKRGYDVEEILHKSGAFSALEQDLPNLCADRIDYNLQGAFYQGFLTRCEVQQIVEDLTFEEGKWVSTKPFLMKKLTRFSLHMTRNCWGSPVNYMTSSWLAKAISKALDSDKLSKEEVFFGVDDLVWNKLKALPDPEIQKMFRQIQTPYSYFDLVSDKDREMHVKMKFRGVDPWIRQKNRVVRLSDIDVELAKEYQNTKELMDKGWSIRLKSLSP